MINIIKKAKEKYQSATIRSRIMLSYIIILIILVIQNIIMLFSTSRLNSTYYQVISNLAYANTLSEMVKDPIDAIAYDVYAGKVDFFSSGLYEAINNIDKSIDYLKSSSISPDNYQRLDVAKRTLDTLRNYVDMMGENIANNGPVKTNEEILEEIRGVTSLLEDIVRDFTVIEINDIKSENDSLRNTSIIITTISFVLFALITVFALFALSRISRSISEPIIELKTFAAKIADGDLKTRAEPAKVSELADLTSSLNTMAEKIQDLINQNIQEQKELKKSEMRALQAQITPHFLYNTLDTITWMAESGRNSDVIKITVALSTFFRISLSRGNDWIKIKEEVDHVRSYLTIQKIRYRDILDYEIDVDEDLNDEYCLKLMLQPLIENALYHGIKYSRHPGKINISVHRDGKLIHFCVKDNGAGMTQEQLNEVINNLNQNDKSTDTSASKGFGLYNVHRRIQLYYNQTNGLNITSEKNVGTTITFDVPFTNPKSTE